MEHPKRDAALLLDDESQPDVKQPRIVEDAVEVGHVEGGEVEPVEQVEQGFQPEEDDDLEPQNLLELRTLTEEEYIEYRKIAKSIKQYMQMEEGKLIKFHNELKFNILYVLMKKAGYDADNLDDLRSFERYTVILKFLHPFRHMLPRNSSCKLFQPLILGQHHLFNKYSTTMKKYYRQSFVDFLQCLKETDDVKAASEQLGSNIPARHLPEAEVLNIEEQHRVAPTMTGSDINTVNNGIAKIMELWIDVKSSTMPEFVWTFGSTIIHPDNFLIDQRVTNLGNDMYRGVLKLKRVYQSCFGWFFVYCSNGFGHFNHAINNAKCREIFPHNGFHSDFTVTGETSNQVLTGIRLPDVPSDETNLVLLYLNGKLIPQEDAAVYKVLTKHETLPGTYAILWVKNLDWLRRTDPGHFTLVAINENRITVHALNPFESTLKHPKIRESMVGTTSGVPGMASGKKICFASFTYRACHEKQNVKFTILQAENFYSRLYLEDFNIVKQQMGPTEFKTILYFKFDNPDPYLNNDDNELLWPIAKIKCDINALSGNTSQAVTTRLKIPSRNATPHPNYDGIKFEVDNNFQQGSLHATYVNHYSNPEVK